MPVTLLLARQRSGTGALGSLLDQHPDVHYAGEVFHADHRNATGANLFFDEQANYFNYLLRKIEIEPRRALPDAAGQNFSDFFAGLRDAFPQKRHTLVDVKYSSTHHFNGGWHSPLDMPKLLRFAMRDEFRIIHLKRRNLVKVFVSGRLAEQAKTWHATSEAALVSGVVRIDRHALLNFLNVATRTTALFDGWLRAYSRVIELEYESLFSADDGMDAGSVERLAGLLDVDGESLRSLRPRVLKQTSDDLRSVIENHDEIARHLAGTPFAGMLAPSSN